MLRVENPGKVVPEIFAKIKAFRKNCQGGTMFTIPPSPSPPCVHLCLSYKTIHRISMKDSFEVFKTHVIYHCKNFEKSSNFQECNKFITPPWHLGFQRKDKAKALHNAFRSVLRLIPALKDIRTDPKFKLENPILKLDWINAVFK
jgi:hypothetical protein